MLLVQPSGLGTYFLSYAIGKARRRLRLGLRNAMTLAQARIAAVDALSGISRGNDPVADAHAP